MRYPLIGAVIVCSWMGLAAAQVCNVKVVTDASPDYSDLPSMVHSITSRWPTPAEKCWAVFYWNHIARRQTQPMDLHGMALTDPIRQFNDYGFTMCSTISGINCGIWHEMGLKARYWDISNHTVPEVFYDGRWHLYDNSMSAIYTLCDGKTIAGVEDIGKPGACAASGGRTEPGHIARYHCLNATSARGFLTGADTIRSLDEEYRCFNPNALKYRSYFFDWDLGHRYILNLTEGEEYTRFYHSSGNAPEYFVPNHGKDPESVNRRYHIRGNGLWTLSLPLKADTAQHAWLPAIQSLKDAQVLDAGPAPAKAGAPGEIVFKIDSANVTTSQQISADFALQSAADEAAILISTSNGLKWQEIWNGHGPGKTETKLALRDQVNSAYSTLIKVRLSAQSRPHDAVLSRLDVRTVTMLNSKTQPCLNLGRNTIYVGAGHQTDSIVLWPELQNGRYKDQIVEEKNVASLKEHPGYQGVIYPTKAKEDAWLVYQIDTPRDMKRLTYGGRFYNRVPRSHIDLFHSFDNGQTWTKSWSLTDTKQPWDVIHYETIDVPAGCRSVRMKYLMNTTDPSVSGCSIYALRMEANYQPSEATVSRPIDVTFRWKERQQDGTLREQSHTQRVEKTPFRYTIDVGGDDHPIMDSLRIALATPGSTIAQGYTATPPDDAQKYVGDWLTTGRNLALGKSYTLSKPSGTNWGAGDPDGKKLTDGIVGPPYAGGVSYVSGAIWNGNANPVITLDLGAASSCASFGMNFHGYEFWDALKGEVKDRVEVLVSDDGQQYTSVGFLQTRLKRKDLPVNHMWPDEEAITGHTFRLILPKPLTARYVQYKVTSPRFFCATELEVLDSITLTPFDLRIALPK